MDRTINDREICAEVAAEAYIFLYPLVLMDITRRVSRVKNPVNSFQHMKEFPPPTYREVVKPNFDTLYSVAWLDISTEPQVISVPDTGDRYYVLPMYDMYTDVFASPGQRTTGSRAGNFVVTLTHWNGDLPPGTIRINSSSKYVWVIGRIQTSGTPEDLAAVHELQSAMSIQSLPQYMSTKNAQPSESCNAHTVDMDTSAMDMDTSAVDVDTPPMQQVDNMDAVFFFQYAMALLRSHPPHVSDWSVLQRMSRYLHLPVDNDRPCLVDFSDRVIDALTAGMASAKEHLMAPHALQSASRMVNGWSIFTHSLGVYGNNYMLRAKIALIGLGALPPTESVYPEALQDADGDLLHAQHGYHIHFDKDELPPANAFWSITLYDDDNFPIPNEAGVIAYV